MPKGERAAFSGSSCLGGQQGPSTIPGDMGLAWVPVIPSTHRVILREFLPLLGPQFSHQCNEGVDCGNPRVSFDSEV